MKLEEQTTDEYLDALYSAISDTPACNSGCCKCCGPVIMSVTEAKRIGMPKGILATRGKGEFGDTCEFVDEETHQCSIYEDRPFICRLFNSTQSKPFTCVELEDHGALNEQEVTHLFMEYTRLMSVDGTQELLEPQLDAIEPFMKQRDTRNGWRKE